MSAKKNPDTKADEKAATKTTQETQPVQAEDVNQAVAVNEKPEKVTIVVADDHAVLRESLAALLGTQPDFEVVGSAKDGAQALELVQAKHPGVLVLDLFMPGSDGFEV